MFFRLHHRHHRVRRLDWHLTSRLTSTATMKATSSLSLPRSRLTTPCNKSALLPNARLSSFYSFNIFPFCRFWRRTHFVPNLFCLRISKPPSLQPPVSDPVSGCPQVLGCREVPVWLNSTVEFSVCELSIKNVCRFGQYFQFGLRLKARRGTSSIYWILGLLR